MLKTNNTNPMVNRPQQLPETLIQQRLRELSDILVDGYKDRIAAYYEIMGGDVPKFQTYWDFDNAADDTVQQYPLPKGATDYAVALVEDALHCSILHKAPNYTELTLFFQSRCLDEIGNLEFSSGKAAIMISPTLLISTPFTRVDDVAKVEIFAGAEYSNTAVSDEDGGQWPPPALGAVYFADEDKSGCAVEFDEISLLVELNESGEYLFAFYSRDNNVLFIKELTSLDDNVLFSDGAVATNTGE